MLWARSLWTFVELFCLRFSVFWFSQLFLAWGAGRSGQPTKPRRGKARFTIEFGRRRRKARRGGKDRIGKVRKGEDKEGKCRLE